MNKTVTEKKAELLAWLQRCGYDNAERELGEVVRKYAGEVQGL